jgi:hypothetical protein
MSVIGENMRKQQAFKRLIFTLIIISSSTVLAHDSRSLGKTLEWRNEHIDKVVTWTDPGRRVSVQGRDCIAGRALNFDIDDNFAFDLDETVWIDVDFYSPEPDTELTVNYNDYRARHFFIKEASTKTIHLIPVKGRQWHRESIALERARFANIGF